MCRRILYLQKCHPEPQAKDLRLLLRVSKRRYFRVGDNTGTTLLLACRFQTAMI
jgi:hypothetical protein